MRRTVKTSAGEGRFACKKGGWAASYLCMFVESVTCAMDEKMHERRARRQGD